MKIKRDICTGFDVNFSENLETKFSVLNVVASKPPHTKRNDPLPVNQYLHKNAGKKENERS